jgi:hypothetical protein
MHVGHMSPLSTVISRPRILKFVFPWTLGSIGPSPSIWRRCLSAHYFLWLVHLQNIMFILSYIVLLVNFAREDAMVIRPPIIFFFQPNRGFNTDFPFLIPDTF